MLTVCGVDCQKSCKSFNNGCAGCNQLMGAVPWVSFIGFSVCPIYVCAREREYATCGECAKIPCSIWLIDTRNPNLTDIEFEKDISTRLENLRKSGQFKVSR